MATDCAGRLCWGCRAWGVARSHWWRCRFPGTMTNRSRRRYPRGGGRYWAAVRRRKRAEMAAEINFRVFWTYILSGIIWVPVAFLAWDFHGLAALAVATGAYGIVGSIVRPIARRSLEPRYQRWLPRSGPPRGSWDRPPIEGMDDARWRYIKREWGNRCAYCGATRRGIGSFHKEHVIPLSRGGPHDWRNIVPACPTCNLSKGTLTGDEYIRARERQGKSINPEWASRADRLRKPTSSSMDGQLESSPAATGDHASIEVQVSPGISGLVGICESCGSTYGYDGHCGCS